MKKSLVRSALLSARLFADARSQPLLRPEGPGVMAIDDALKTLIDDGATQAARHSQWLTRLRVAGGLQEALDPEIPRPDAAMAAPAYVGAANGVKERLETVAKGDAAATLAEATAEWARLKPLVGELAGDAKAQAPQSVRDRLSITPGVPSADRGARALDWQTEVIITPGGATKVTSFVEAEGVSFAPLARLCDPRRWSESSLFWLQSSELDEKGQPIDDDPPDEPAEWHGKLLEVVASTVAIFTAVLRIDFEVENDSCLVEYKLDRPMDGLIKDDGYAYVTRVAQDRYRTQIVKWVDFRDAPFGGPSVMDQCLPSYLGSWLRTQQDLWAAEAFMG